MGKILDNPGCVLTVEKTDLHPVHSGDLRRSSPLQPPVLSCRHLGAR